MKKFASFLVAVMLVLTFFPVGDLAVVSAGSQTVKYVTAPSDGPVANPHKGFVMTVYSPWTFSPDNPLGVGGSGNNQAWNVVTICSGAPYWKDLNPEEGVYDWSSIDAVLEECEKYGMTYGIRVIPYSTSEGSDSNGGKEHDLVPEWVYKKGAKHTKATYRWEDSDAELQVPDWSDPVYLKACKDFASAMAKEYDNDPRIEFIDVRPFGNWGEWHTTEFVGSNMPSLEIQKDMLDYYRSVFKNKTLAVPYDAQCEDVYGYANSIGITSRNDAMIMAADAEYELIPSYEANLPVIAENHNIYATMLEYHPGYKQWTPQRFRDVINTAHMSIYALDQASDNSYRFYSEQKDVIDEMVNKIGYNYTVVSAVRTDNKLEVVIKNTGLAPSFFDIQLCAEITDGNGNKKELFGTPVTIPSGTFHDDTEKKFVFEYSGTLSSDSNICLAMYDINNSLVSGGDPTIRFDNSNTLSNNRFLLVPESIENGDNAGGWSKENGNWYYYDTNGKKVTGWLKDADKWYYLQPDGVMATGWLKTGNNWYYLDSSGAMATGWVNVGGTWYYMNQSGAMATGWHKEGNSWYYLKSSGAMVTGWVNVGGTWYYMNQSGAMVTGWLKEGNNWYYLYSSGAMATGWINVGGVWYFLYGSGAMASNTWIGDCYVNAGGAWTQSR